MESKRCSKCLVEKQITEFPKNKQILSGIAPRCYDCSRIDWRAYTLKNRERTRKYQKEWKARNIDKCNAYYQKWRTANPNYHKRESALQSVLKSTYDLPWEIYQKLLLAQNNCCAICRGDNKGKRLFVDHDHNTKKVRGLLCRKCNIGLGYLESQDGNWCPKAKQYLNFYNLIAKAA